MSVFGGSKSKSSTSQSQVGSQTQLGDPTSINVSSGKKSNTNINIVRTDFGSVGKAFNLAAQSIQTNERNNTKVLGVISNQAKLSNNFALDTIAAAERVSSDIIEAGQYSAGATERIAGAFEAFVDEQNNPNEKNQMWLIVGVVGVLAFVVVNKK